MYYDFLQLGPVKLGADVRGSILTTKRGAYVNFNGGGARIYSALGGVRARVSYAYEAAEAVSSVVGGPWAQRLRICLRQRSNDTAPVVLIYNNFQYEGLAGLDIKLLPIMDWRVVEFGYGGLDPFGTYSHNYPIKQVSMGFVFHLP